MHMSEDHQRHQDESPADHEYAPNFMAIHAIVEDIDIFVSGPKWWTDRPASPNLFLLLARLKSRIPQLIMSFSGAYSQTQLQLVTSPHRYTVDLWLFRAPGGLRPLCTSCPLCHVGDPASMLDVHSTLLPWSVHI